MFRALIKGPSAQEDRQNDEEVDTAAQTRAGLQDTQETEKEAGTVAESSTGESLDLAKIAAATLNIMQE